MPIAKQIPCAGRIVAVLTPITSALRIDQRAAGISGVQSGVGLNHILDQAPRVRAQRSPQRADHARRHGGLKPVRIADRNRHLARPQLLRISQWNGLQSGNIDSNDGKIGGRIIADGVSRSAPSVRQRHFDPRRVVHDVAIGENQSIGREDEAGAASTALAGLTRTSSACRLELLYFNVHYRRTDSLNRSRDRPRVGVEQASVAGFGSSGAH